MHNYSDNSDEENQIRDDKNCREDDGSHGGRYW